MIDLLQSCKLQLSMQPGSIRIAMYGQTVDLMLKSECRRQLDGCHCMAAAELERAELAIGAAHATKSCKAHASCITPARCDIHYSCDTQSVTDSIDGEKQLLPSVLLLDPRNSSHWQYTKHPSVQRFPDLCILYVEPYVYNSAEFAGILL